MSEQWILMQWITYGIDSCIAYAFDRDCGPLNALVLPAQ